MSFLVEAQPIHSEHPRTRRSLRRRLFHLMRLMHIATAMLGLAVMLFFALTGFFLRHRSLLGRMPPRVRTSTAMVPLALLHGPDNAALVDFFRKTYGAIGKVRKFELSDRPIHLTFLAGGRRLDATIDSGTGTVTITRQYPSLMNRLMELHRGAYGGRVWGYVMDATSIVISLIALTGIIIWLPLKRWRLLGLITLVLGTGFCVLTYLLFIP